MERRNMQSIKSRSERLPNEFADLVRRLPPQAIHDKVGYANMQEMIDQLTSLGQLSAGQAEYLETLTILFEAHEKVHEQIEIRRMPPRKVLRFLLDANGMTGSDLGRLLGNRELGPKILSGRRQLSKAH